MSELTNIENGKVKLSLKIPAEDYRRALESAYRRTGAHYNISGFRKGKVPRKVIEATYGVNVFWDEEFDSLVQSVYSDALAEHNLVPEIQPNIEFTEVSEQDGVSFTAEVVLHPTVKLGQYKGIEAPVIEYNVTDEEVSAEIQKKLNEMATEAAVEDRPVRQGDIVTLDFAGFMGDEQFEGGTAEGYKLKIGSGSFIPGFEEQMVGMNIGDERDINVTFPEDYHADLAGKKVVFHVKAKEIKCKELPKLDDDFAKDVSEYDTLKELKDSIKREITEQREQSAKYAVENELMEKVAANIECDIPDALIDEQCARFLEEFKQRLQSQGIPYDQYCKMTNMDEAKFLEEGKEPATRQVRMDLAVNAIIKEEKLEATDEEVEKQYNDLAEKYSMDVNELKKYLDAMSVRTQIIRDKAISVVVDSAKIEKKKAPKKEAEGEAAEGEEKPAKKTAAKKSAKKEEEKAE